jgi:hypothetical protein
LIPSARPQRKIKGKIITLYNHNEYNNPNRPITLRKQLLHRNPNRPLMWFSFFFFCRSEVFISHVSVAVPAHLIFFYRFAKASCKTDLRKVSLVIETHESLLYLCSSQQIAATTMSLVFLSQIFHYCSRLCDHNHNYYHNTVLSQAIDWVAGSYYSTCHCVLGRLAS